MPDFKSMKRTSEQVRLIIIALILHFQVKPF